jgi:uncharacterized protein YqgC (DUF456 family)
VVAASAANTAATGSPVIDLATLSGPTAADYVAGAMGANKLGTYAVWGALAVAGLALLLPRDRRN